MQASSSAERWSAVAAIAAAGTVLVKNIFSRKPAPKLDLVTRAEFHQGLDGLRDKLEANQRELLAALASQGRSIEQRLDRLETGLARVDERTRR